MMRSLSARKIAFFAPFALGTLLAAAGCEPSVGAETAEIAAKPVAALSGAAEGAATEGAATSGTEVAVGAAPAEEDESCAGMAEGAEGEAYGAEGGGCGQWDEAAAKIATREAPEGAEWKVFSVSGMTCGGCERRVIANVGTLEGVLAVEADAELGQVRVAHAPGAAEVGGRAAEAINGLGYQVAQ